MNSIKKLPQTIIYAARINDRDVLRSSSSGGLFTVLSDPFLRCGGAIVCSVYQYDSHRIEFCLITEKSKRDCAKDVLILNARLADPRMNVSDMVVNLLDVLPLKGAQVNTFRSASRFQIAVGDGLPAMPPNLGVLLVVPVHGVFLVAFPVPRRESDALAIFVKVVYLAGFWEPLAVFIHCPERQQNVGVWVSIFLVVDGKVGDHSFGNKLFLTKFFYHGKVLLFRDFHRERQHDAPGKLGVPLVLHGFHGVPEGRPVCISGRRMGRQHDLSVDKFFLLVVEFRFLVVLAEQPFAALVSGPGNSGLSLAAFDDGDFEVRTRNRNHPQTKRPPSKIALDKRSGIVFCFRSPPWFGVPCASLSGGSRKRIAAKQRKENAVFLGMESESAAVQHCW